MGRKLLYFVFFGALIVPSLACGGFTSTPQYTSSVEMKLINRGVMIPQDAVKMSADADDHPPLTLSSDFEGPVPVPGSVNTVGAEDSPFILPNGNMLYFFFTPDVDIPVEKQVIDGVTGIYVSEMGDDVWGEPEFIRLQGSGKLALNGCAFVLENTMWFCSAREGYTGLHWFTVEFESGKWKNWRIADFDPGYNVGELHISSDEAVLYFHSDRPGGMGELDIWLSKKINNLWQEPINVTAINSSSSEGWPALNPDGNELWFSRDYGIWRSQKVHDEWQVPEQIITPLSGEPSIDRDGNLYFVHHFFENGKMIEADIYVAYRK